MSIEDLARMPLIDAPSAPALFFEVKGLTIHCQTLF